MIRYQRRARFLAIGLSALAGFVNAVGFLELGGFFVSFMSGNTTRMAAGMAQTAEPPLIAAASAKSSIAGHILKAPMPVIGRLLLAR